MSIYRGSNEVDLFWRNGKPVNKVKYGGVDVLNRLLVEKQTLHSEVNFTANNKRHYWDSNGILQTVDANVPRFNFNPATGLYEGFVTTGQWTNEILDPRDMTTGNWAKSDVTVLRNQVGIDGDANTSNSISGNSIGDRVHQTITIPSDSNTHTLVAYIRKNTGTCRFANIGMPDQQLLDLNSNDGSSSAGLNVEDKGGYYKIWFTTTNDGTATSFQYSIYPDATTGLVADAVQVFLNRSSPPPTPVYGEVAGQSYTQDPDIATVATLSDIDYNSDEDTLVIGFNSAYSEGTLFDLHTDANNRIYAHRNASNEIHLVIVDGGTTQADLNLGTIADNTAGKIAVGWKANDIAGALNGGTVQTDTTATIPAVTDLNIGRDYNDANYWDAFIGDKLNYPRKLTNGQIQDESKL